MQQYLKAVYGAVAAGLASASTAYAQGNGHIGIAAGIAIAVSVVGAFGVVWGVPNQSAAAAPTPSAPPAPPAPPA